MFFRLKPETEIHSDYNKLKSNTFFGKIKKANGKFILFDPTDSTAPEYIVNNTNQILIAYKIYKLKPKRDIQTAGIYQLTSNLEYRFHDTSYEIPNDRNVVRDIKSNLNINTEDLIEDTSAIPLYSDKYYKIKDSNIEIYGNRYIDFIFNDTHGIVEKQRPVKVKDLTIDLNHLMKVSMTDVLELVSKSLDGKWSMTRTKDINFKSDHLAEQIRTRYAMFDRPTNGLSNVIIDSFVPRMLYRSKFNIPSAIANMNPPKTAVAISPWFASMFGVKQMEIEQLCRILGYDKRDIKQLFDKVKKKQYTICFIGYGGTNVNTIHWLSKMANMTHSINIFDETIVYEPEEAEISNLLRFPLNPLEVEKISPKSTRTIDNAKHLSSKLSMLGHQLDRITKGQVETYPFFYKRGMNAKVHSNQYKKDDNGTILRDENRNVIHEILAAPKTIIYGAPGIATRTVLSEYGNFISATHGDADCRLDLNPHQDQELQVESYGVIQLGGFFMNQLRLAIGFLETLADDNFDPQAKDVTLMEYSFNGQSVKQTDRTYNFQLDFDGLVLTEDQANQNT